MKRFFYSFLICPFTAVLFSAVAAFAQTPAPTAPAGSRPFAPAQGDIHGPRGLWVIHYGKYLWWGLAILVLLAIVAGLIWFLVRYWRRRKPVKSLYETVMERLADCRTLIQEGNAREFSGTVSGIVREYLEQRFAVPVTHQTTEEFIRTATQGAKHGLAAYIPQLQDFLGYCDMAKFARSELDVSQMQLMLDSATRFVAATKPVEESAESPAAAVPVTRKEATS